MTYADSLTLIVWVFIVFWAIWYVYVQLERLNRKVFERLKSTVLKRAEKSTGVLRAIGLVVYSPYVMPVRAAFAWLVIVLVMFIF